jgi:hypothetical protein
MPTTALASISIYRSVGGNPVWETASIGEVFYHNGVSSSFTVNAILESFNFGAGIQYIVDATFSDLAWTGFDNYAWYGVNPLSPSDESQRNINVSYVPPTHTISVKFTCGSYTVPVGGFDVYFDALSYHITAGSVFSHSMGDVTSPASGALTTTPPSGWLFSDIVPASVSGSYYTNMGEIISGWTFAFSGVPYPGKADTPSPVNASQQIIALSTDTITLSWTKVAPLGTGYDVWLGPTGSMTKISSNQTANFKAVTVNEGVEYEWRIDANITLGSLVATTTGDVWTFTADSLAIALDEPENNTSYGGTVFSWTKTGTATPDHYVLYIEDFNPATDPNSPYIIGPINALIKDIAPSTLVVGSTYLWIVFAQDAGNNDIGLSDTWYFTVAPLSKPVNPTPEDTTAYRVNPANQKYFIWEDGNQDNPATTYNLALTNFFSGLELDIRDIPVTKVPSKADPNTEVWGGICPIPPKYDGPYATLTLGKRYQWAVDAYGPIPDGKTEADREHVVGDWWGFGTLWQWGSYRSDSEPDYNPDYQWQYSSGQYGWFGIDVAGGGRYKRSLIIIGHRCIYVSM